MRKYIILFILLFISFSYTQDLEIPMQYGDRPAQYILGGKDILLININLWGHIQRPGIYSIPNNNTIFYF